MKFLSLAVACTLACSSILYAGTAKSPHSHVSLDKIDVSAFEYFDEKIENLNISVFESNGDQGISIKIASLPEYSLYIGLKTPVKKSKSWYGATKFILPSSILTYTGIKDHDSGYFVGLNGNIVYTTENGKNYVALSDQGRVDLFTNSDGELIRIRAVWETKVGGMDHYKNFMDEIENLAEN